MISGSIDRLTADGAVGWIYRADSTIPAKLRAFLDNEVVGETVADRYRPDLQQVGLGDGHCGFDMEFFRPLSLAQLPFLKIKPESIDLSLSLTEKTIYLDLLHAVLRDAQGAGRNRSVLGGLWTDRTDASQVLAGRVAVGTCAAELQPMVQELIYHGYVVLPGVLAPKGLQQKDSAALKSIAQRSTFSAEQVKEVLDGMAKLLFRDSAVRLMQTVFDDNPVIYRLDRVMDETVFHQAAMVEPLPSPAESLLIYGGFPGTNARLEIVRNSHELSEFGPGGFSRWTADGAKELGALAEQQGLSIDEVEFSNLDLVIVGPGLVHRVVASEEAPVLRALAAPRRVTPLKYLSGERPWVEAMHVSGARVRV